MRHLVNTTCMLAVLVLVAFLTAAWFAPAPAQARTMRPCPNDSDSRNCVWDARHMGNGIGHSYLATRTGKIIRISHQRAHRLLGL